MTSTPECSIVISAFGDRSWMEMAYSRALASSRLQENAEIVFIYAETADLSRARNHGAQLASGKYLVFLDADDQLEPGYTKAMLEGEGDLRYPSVRQIPYLEGEYYLPDAYLPVPKHLFGGNYMVIGTMIRRDLFLQVGGFDPWPAYEDWALWIKCWLAGAVIRPCEKAVYRAFEKRGQTRNILDDPKALFDKIVGTYREEAVRKGLA